MGVSLKAEGVAPWGSGQSREGPRLSEPVHSPPPPSSASDTFLHKTCTLITILHLTESVKHFQGSDEQAESCKVKERSPDAQHVQF